MTLKINNWKKIVPICIYVILGILFLVFLIRVIVFENDYYGSKEGSERSVAPDSVSINETIEPVDETEFTEQQIAEYTVAPDRPRYLTISRIGVEKARVISVGVRANGELGTPNNIFDAGWYDGSSKPGQGGTLIIDGHNGGPTKVGIFKYLPSVRVGDHITIERGDGAVFNYVVKENITVSLDEANAYMATAGESPEPGKESVTLITCTGDWSEMRQTYLSRQFLRAVLE